MNPERWASAINTLVNPPKEIDLFIKNHRAVNHRMKNRIQPVKTKEPLPSQRNLNISFDPSQFQSRYNSSVIQENNLRKLCLSTKMLQQPNKNHLHLSRPSPFALVDQFQRTYSRFQSQESRGTSFEQQRQLDQQMQNNRGLQFQTSQNRPVSLGLAPQTSLTLIQNPPRVSIESQDIHSSVSKVQNFCQILGSQNRKIEQN